MPVRLINISRLDKLEFHTVADPSRVRYAILSHVWNKNDGSGNFIEEPTFHDLSLAMQPPYDLSAPKFNKLRGFFHVAAKDGYHLVWADMCCIDKTSSAEVSESIASMYVWYSCAEVCYAYLNDVPSCQQGLDTLVPVLPEEFCRSRWFTRGWTLQELVAPKALVFFSKDWTVLGTKRSLSRNIQQITSIDVEVLSHERELRSITVARRMSWAANRSTSRQEDRAYSLMGLFGVRIPVLYGEQGYAFIRLQREILKRIPDLTLLAWGPRCRLSDILLDLSNDSGGLDAAGSDPRAREEDAGANGPGEAVQPIHVRARRGRTSR